MKESVKIDSAIVDKVRQRIKKTKQTIGGFFELAAKSELVLTPPDKQVSEWKEKAQKWDRLAQKIAQYYPEDENDAPGDLGDIGEHAAMAFGYL